MKPVLDSVLPFSSGDFFWFLAITVSLCLGVKTFFKERIPYKWLLALVSLGYLILMYPKPFNILVLTGYLYVVILSLRKWYTSDNVALPMILLALPMIGMKGFGLVSDAGGFSGVQKFLQIAGISYMVFKAISLYIDGRRSPEAVIFLDVFVFLAFVPTLLIGPLDRFKRFMTDVENGYQNMSKSFLLKGWNNLILGLLYKFIIAEAIRRLLLAYLVDDGSVIYHISYMYTYLFYLFFDFAGYSLLAIGFGNLLGIDVPINFNKPFLAVNPKEFWKRWHKTLGDWLNDYFFKPLFKYFTQKKIRTSIQRQGLALFLTFTLMGCWNGFERHYILSGMLFGLYSLVHNYYVYRCKKTKREVFFGSLSPRIVKISSIFMMFNLVAFAIYIFSGNLI
ncbi:MAG: MBOAT family O-acyltransferase [Flavobacteriales bacterium]